MTELGVGEIGVKAPRRVNKVVLYFFGALAGFLFGYDLGVISGVLLWIKKLWDLDSFARGVVSSCFAAGAMVGAVGATRMIERLGRRRSIMIGAAIFGLGTLGCVLSPAAGVFIVVRFIAGVGVGVTSATVPAYLSELAPTRIRGGLSALNQIMILVGLLVAYIIAWALSGSGDWRLMIAFGLVPAIAIVIGMPFLPETPRWLLKVGRETEARAVIRTAQGADVDVDAEVQEIRDVIKRDTEQHGRLRDLLQPWARPALIVALIVGFGEQLSGGNAVNLYAPSIFTNLGIGTSAALLASVCFGTAKLLLCVWVIFAVDRWGRRPLMLVGNLIMVGILAALAIEIMTLHASTTAAGITTLILIIAYMVGYEFASGALVWVIMSEVLPLRVRGVGMGVGAAGLWAGTFTVTLVFPVMDSGLGLSGTMWVFTAVCITLFLLVKRYVPETKGRSLEEIELDTRRRVGLQQTAVVATAAGEEATSDTATKASHENKAIV